MIKSLEPKLKVVCGGHKATRCEECPQGHGRSWCQYKEMGVCTWDERNSVCTTFGKLINSYEMHLHTNISHVKYF